MSILAMTIAQQLAEDALGPLYGSHIAKDTKLGRLARAAKSAAQMKLIRHLGDVPEGEWRYDAPGFAERLAEARRIAGDAAASEIEFLRRHRP
jgi:hypothetical protein